MRSLAIGPLGFHVDGRGIGHVSPHAPILAQHGTEPARAMTMIWPPRSVEEMMLVEKPVFAPANTSSKGKPLETRVVGRSPFGALD